LNEPGQVENGPKQGIGRLFDRHYAKQVAVIRQLLAKHLIWQNGQTNQTTKE
jgi:hypothetical protein